MGTFPITLSIYSVVKTTGKHVYMFVDYLIVIYNVTRLTNYICIDTVIYSIIELLN